MSYTFSTNVPKSGQLIKATQTPIQSNFQAINELISVNHVGFNDPNNFGKHNVTTFPAQTLDPSTLSGEMALYSKETPNGPNEVELFYRYPLNGAIVQLTGSSTANGAATDGFAYLSPTVFMKWGYAPTGKIVFPVIAGYPEFTQTPYQVYFTAANPYTPNEYSTPFATNISPTEFSMAGYQNYSANVFWLAIGV